MGVHLDWDYEAPDGDHKLGDDPHHLAQLQRRARRLRRGAVAGAILALIAVIPLLIRMQQVASLREDMLIATAESEALALRIGDAEAFMKRQAPGDLWREAQRDSFEAYRKLSARIELSGKVLAAEIEGDEAAVTLSARVDGREHRFMWMYEYVEDKGWRHTASEDVPWDVRSMVGRNGIRYLYHAVDEPLVQALDTTIAGWWDMLGPLTGTDIPDLSVRVEPDPSLISAMDDGVLVVSSLSPEGQPLTELSAAMLDQVAALLADAWARQALPDASPSRSSRWAPVEIAAVLQAMMRPETKSATVLSPFIDLYGPGFLQDFLRHMREHELAAALHNAIGENQQAYANTRDLQYHLQAMITSQIACFAAGNGPCPVASIYADWESINNPFALALGYMRDAEGLTIKSAEIISIRRIGEIAWAEIAIQFQADDGGLPSYLADRDTRQAVPFRQVDSTWVQTGVGRSEVGSESAMSGQFITLRYTEQDAPFAAGLLDSVEADYAQIAADFGVAELQPIHIIIRAFSPGRSGLLDQPARLEVVSPYTCCLFDSLPPDQRLRRDIMQELIHYVIALRASEHSWVYNPLGSALVSWEMQRLGLTDGPYYFGDELAEDDLPLSPLDAWGSVGSHTSYETYQASLIAARTLIETIEAKYGVEAIAALVERLDPDLSVDDWLYTALGIHTWDILPEWDARYDAARLSLLEDQR